MKNEPRSPVVLRVAAAIQHLISEDPAGRLSVAAVCRLAEVSRANLYENHPSLLRQIQDYAKRFSTPKATRVQTNNAALQDEVRLLRKQVKALTLICIEQRVALETLQRDQARFHNRLQESSRKRARC